jgi:hypothetical protein
MDNVGVGEAIEALRVDLTDALRAGQGQEVRFRLGPVELEFEVDVERQGGAGGGIKFWVVSAEAKGQLTNKTLHRIKLSLQPIGSEEQDLAVASEQASRPR